MSILPMYRKCIKCKKEFSMNPSVGKIRCPYCGSLGGMPIDDVPIPRPRAPREGIGLGESPVQDNISLPKVIKKFIKK